MAALWWWVIPVTATLLAILWAGWVSRPRTKQEAINSVETYERFRSAMDVHQRRSEEMRRPTDVR